MNEKLKPVSTPFSYGKANIRQLILQPRFQFVLQDFFEPIKRGFDLTSVLFCLVVVLPAHSQLVRLNEFFMPIQYAWLCKVAGVQLLSGLISGLYGDFVFYFQPERCRIFANITHLHI